MQSMAGLTSNNVKSILCGLDFCQDKNIAKAFNVLIEILESSLFLISKEMFSTRANIVYWDHFNKGSYWEITLAKWNSRIFRGIFFQIPYFENILNNPQDMIQYVESLQADFNELAVIFGKFQESIGHLKEIYGFIQRHGIFDSRLFNSEIALILQEQSKIQMILCLQSILFIYQHHLPSFYQQLLISEQGNLETLIGLFSQAQLEGFSILEPSEYETSENLEQISSLQLYQTSMSLQAYLRHTIIQSAKQQFPLGFTTIHYPLPSYYERYFFRNIVFTLFGAYSMSVLVPMTMDGRLEQIIHNAIDTMKIKFYDHIYEPVTKLHQELFDTISCRDHIVSKQDLELSRDALQRMLYDFAKSTEGISLLERLRLVKDNLKNIKGLDELDLYKLTDLNNTPSSLELTPELALQALMMEYENEIKTPIKGIMVGNLFTAILIQMQKLKVHTEAAMLTMDQIMASNQLTIAGVAALPAFIFFGFAGVYLKNSFSPNLSTKYSAMHLGLVLADVERSLQELSKPSSVSYGSTASLAGFKTPQPLSPMLKKSGHQHKAFDPRRHFYLAKGLLYFNLTRLRFKFHELFDDSSNSIDSMVKPSKPSHRLTVYNLQSPLVPLTTTEWILSSVNDSINSAKQLIQSFLTMLFGSYELKSNTTLYHSLDMDLTLLESPESEVSLDRKIETIRRMRQSYQCFAPANTTTSN